MTTPEAILLILIEVFIVAVVYLLVRLKKRVEYLEREQGLDSRNIERLHDEIWKIHNPPRYNVGDIARYINKLHDSIVQGEVLSIKLTPYRVWQYETRDPLCNIYYITEEEIRSEQ